MTAAWEGEPLRLDTVGACSKPGTLVALSAGLFPQAHYGPIRLLCCWAKGYKASLYLVTNMTTAEAAYRMESKRFRIEPFFSDQKRRGFHLHQSHLADPQRLARWRIAAC